jgi:2-haloacid dehalogenase
MERWATFDCYGTLVDWNAGIGRELARLLGGDEPALLKRYHEVEPRVQADDPSLAYRDVMARVLAELARENDVELPDSERDALGRSLPSWPVFPEVPPALAEMRRRGWKLGALTNSDRDLIEASIGAIGVPFDIVIPAGEIDSYKPAHRHWEEFFARAGADRRGHVHVAQSYFHDIVPANQLGMPSIWINRLGEVGDVRPTRELRDLSALPGTADELVPPAA